VLTVVALATSMFWFPAPERVDPRAAEFLAVEREYLTSGWSLWKVMLALLVPITSRRSRWRSGSGRLSGAGGDQRHGAGQDRMEFLLWGRVGRTDLAAFRPRGLGGLRRGDPVRRAQDAQEFFAEAAQAGKPA
jgi:hypothetical protein